MVIPSGPTQPGAEFIKNSEVTDGRGWTNELHVFDVQKGEGGWLLVVDANYPRKSVRTLQSIIVSYRKWNLTFGTIDTVLYTEVSIIQRSNASTLK